MSEMSESKSRRRSPRAIRRDARNRRIAAARMNGESWSQICAREGLSERHGRRAEVQGLRNLGDLYQARALGSVAYDEQALVEEAWADDQQLVHDIGEADAAAATPEEGCGDPACDVAIDLRIERLFRLLAMRCGLRRILIAADVR